MQTQWIGVVLFVTKKKKKQHISKATPIFIHLNSLCAVPGPVPHVSSMIRKACMLG